MDGTDSKRWREIEALYNAVVEQHPDQREKLLARADPEVRGEVESLLAQKSGDGILHHSAWDSAMPIGLESADPPLAPGTQLGRYRLESVLGNGGMGKVYRARDTRLGRLVAIKVSNEQFSARFEQEARAISSLNHPNICTLYDGSELSSNGTGRRAHSGGSN